MQMFKPLIDKGFVRILNGGAATGQTLVNHPTVASIHLTGSAATFDAIVWQGAKKVGKPPFTKPVYGELGCITPCIIASGEWTSKQLQFAAKCIVDCKIFNTSCSCASVEVIVTQKGWKQTQEFLDLVKSEAARRMQHGVWYPGAQEKYRKFHTTFPDAAELGVKVADPRAVPLLFAMNLSPENAALWEEKFSPTLQHVEVEGDGVDDFLEAATKFVNEECWGNLAVSVFVPPEVKAEYPSAVEACVDGLRYGSVVVNLHAIAAFVATSGVWGGFPGNRLQDIQSGNALRYNSLFFDHPQKQVLHYKFGEELLEASLVPTAMLTFVAMPSWGRLLGLVIKLAASKLAG